ncbi:MAG TPA: D-alanyl-D-alanine carboxypeptidase family protein [Armatimonadota bacterium]|jgi:D-alanyl-D-alanine carboxypeptidase (penicillin-binding protein 5/6)
MTKWVSALAVLLSAVTSARPQPAPPDILSPAGILVEAKTGKVLWAHNPDQQRPMASTTKIMTALLVLESGRLNETVQVSAKAAKVAESSLNLKMGEHLTMDDLLHGIIMRSANDACVVAAEHLDGSVGAFVAQMNARAAQLGCKHTHFANPNGLQATGHYSTPRDLATMARAAMAYPVFRDIVSTPDYTIERDINKYDRGLKARDHWFLTHYEGADGVKTGYTRQAGHCFVASATRGGFQLISVLMHSPNIKKETRALLDWGFANYRGGVAAKPGRPLAEATVTSGSAASVPVGVASPAYAVVPKDAGAVLVQPEFKPVRAPVTAGQVVGRAVLVADGRAVGHVDLIALNEVDLSPWRKAGRVAVVVLSLGLGGAIVGTASKVARRRRRRLSARRRRPDPRRARVREWDDVYPR